MSTGREQACNYCGESMGVFEHRYSDGPLSCGSKECARAERPAKSAERFVNEECAVYDAQHIQRALERRDHSATTDGIATGLSRALVALEGRAEQLDVALSAEIRRRAEYGSLVIDGYEDCLGRRDEARGNCALIRSLLEALVD